MTGWMYRENTPFPPAAFLLGCVVRFLWSLWRDASFLLNWSRVIGALREGWRGSFWCAGMYRKARFDATFYERVGVASEMMFFEIMRITTQDYHETHRYCASPCSLSPGCSLAGNSLPS